MFFSTFADLLATDDVDAKRLLFEQADAIMVQETHLSVCECEDESCRFRLLGWNCLFSPAVACIDGRRGSGIGGLLSSCAQHHELGVIEGVDCVIVPGRAACCLHSGFSKAGVVPVNVYLHDKIGMAAANLRILFLVAERVRMIGRPY
eukprot:580069-Pyramimonas_sp.AAC.2